MCEIFKEYKLCTCSDKIDKTKPYWVLNKGTPKTNIYFNDNNRFLIISF